jgi:hypothetical protein
MLGGGTSLSRLPRALDRQSRLHRLPVRDYQNACCLILKTSYWKYFQVRDHITIVVSAFHSGHGYAGCGSGRVKDLDSRGASSLNFDLLVGDGDPPVPVCNGAMQNCKDFTVLDQTTGMTLTVPIIVSSYTANPAHTYGVRINDFDGQGNSISSECHCYSDSVKWRSCDVETGCGSSNEIWRSSLGPSLSVCRVEEQEVTCK